MIETRITADLMRAQSTAQAAILSDAAQGHAAAGRVVEAIAAAWAVEVLRLQATLAGQILLDRRAPNYRYFEAAEAIMTGLDQPWKPGATAADTIRAGRDALARVVEPVVLSQLSDSFGSLAYLESLPALDQAAVEAFARTRLQGRTAGNFVRGRREEAADAMLRAQALRLQGDVPAAVRLAYEGDFGSLEAYLVESAVAVGDAALFTVSARWDLAAFAMSQLVGLPGEFEPAVTLIREAMAQALGEPDGSRLRPTFTAL